MGNWLIRRLLVTLLTLFIGTTVVFSLVHIIPGDPVSLMIEEHFSQESYDNLERRLGLDRPLWQQYVSYIGDVVRGDWGTSFRTNRDVFSDIKSQFPYTVQLALAGITIAALIGIPAGIISAVYHGRMIDHIVMFIAVLGICMPSFWLAILLLLLFSLHLGWLPSVGVGDSWRDSLPYLLLPALAIGVRSAAMLARMSRSAMLDVLHQDYIRTARAKGLQERLVILRHGLGNAMIPILTVLGLDLGSMLAGTTIIEIVFSRPGVGRMLIDAVLARDYPMIQGTLLFFVLIIVLANTLVDILYSVVDPRISVS